MKDYQRKYYREHKEKFKQYRKTQYKKRKDKYKNDPEYRKKIIERQRIKSLRYYNIFRKERDNLIQKRGNKCERCGINDSRVLILHHPNGLTFNRRNISEKIKEIRNHPENLEIICYNCHAIIHDLKNTLRKVGKHKK